jgi:transketolase
MTSRDHPSDTVPVEALRARARSLRRHMLRMASRLGQGYIGQGLGLADVLAALYFSELRHDPRDPAWPDRDRFIMSTGHYSIALWAVLAETGLIPEAELDSYGADGSRLPMSTLDTTPGVEVTGGSLGHGLGVGLGIAQGLRLAGRRSRVFVELSDGELQEGATWEAAMAAAHFGLDRVVALNDCNGIQADGRIVLNMEPVAEKWRAFGWDTVEIDGNDLEQITKAFRGSRAGNGRPKAIVLRTLPGKGVPEEWELFRRELEAARD